MQLLLSLPITPPPFSPSSQPSRQSSDSVPQPAEPTPHPPASVPGSFWLGSSFLTLSLGLGWAYSFLFCTPSPSPACRPHTPRRMFWNILPILILQTLHAGPDSHHCSPCCHPDIGYTGALWSSLAAPTSIPEVLHPKPVLPCSHFFWPGGLSFLTQVTAVAFPAHL